MPVLPAQMSKDQFVAWQKHLGISNAEAGRRLGKSADTIGRYRTQGVPASEAIMVGLACSALALGVPPWHEIRR
jgi:hypothetical protein